MNKISLCLALIFSLSANAFAQAYSGAAAGKTLGQKSAKTKLVEGSTVMRNKLSAEDYVRLEISKKYPATQITSIKPSGIEGIFEVVMGNNVAYVDSTVKYFLFGHLFDMATQRDITQDRIDDMTKVNFSALPLEKAVKVVKGNGSRSFAVFTDPDCPYCKQLEQNLAELDNYTMYVFMYPIPQLHPAAEEHANAVWCASDRSAAWTSSMKTGTFPQSKDCQTPTKEVMELGAKLGVQGTPTLFRMDGKKLGGAQPAPQIDNWLNNK